MSAPAKNPRRLPVVERGRLVWRKEAADVPEFWDRHWRAYPPGPPVIAPLPVWFARPIERFLPRDGVIVEAGCGNGEIVRLLRVNGFDIEGLDFAPDVVEANRAADPGGRYRAGDVRDLPYPAGSLAGYISLGVVEHFERDTERERILLEAWRCLRPGGVAFVTTPYFSPLRRARSLAGGFPARSPAAGAREAFYQYGFTARDLGAQLRSAGFDLLDLDYYDAFKGIRSALGGERLMRWYEARGPRQRAFVKHPWWWIRALAAHMVLAVGRKPPGAAALAAPAAPAPPAPTLAKAS